MYWGRGSRERRSKIYLVFPIFFPKDVRQPSSHLLMKQCLGLLLGQFKTSLCFLLTLSHSLSSNFRSRKLGRTLFSALMKKISDLILSFLIPFISKLGNFVHSWLTFQPRCQLFSLFHPPLKFGIFFSERTWIIIFSLYIPLPFCCMLGSPRSRL